jgi:hypothetical protein
MKHHLLAFALLSLVACNSVTPAATQRPPTIAPTPSTCNVDEILLANKADRDKFEAGQTRLEQSTVGPSGTFAKVLAEMKTISTESESRPVHSCAERLKAETLLWMNNIIEAHQIAYDTMVLKKISDPGAKLFNEKLQEGLKHYKLVVEEINRLDKMR